MMTGSIQQAVARSDIVTTRPVCEVGRYQGNGRCAAFFFESAGVKVRSMLVVMAGDGNIIRAKLFGSEYTSFSTLGYACIGGMP